MAADNTAKRINGTLRERGIDIPLLRGVHQTHATAGGNTYTALDKFHAGCLLVTENALITVGVNQNVDTLGFKIAPFVDLKLPGLRPGTGSKCT